VLRIFASAGSATEVRRPTANAVGRVSYVALLIAAPLLPQIGNSYWTYPAVSRIWVFAPLCGLFLLPLVDVRRAQRISNLDLLVLLSFAVALGSWGHSSFFSLLFIYAPLAYLCVRMLLVARVGRTPAPPCAPVTAPRPWLPSSWLLAGIVVLVAVHVNWTLNGRVNTDVGPASIRGALQLVHGRSVYGANGTALAELGYDPHEDAYGPVVYESYIPFASVAGTIAGARLAALFFDLLTAALLFALGRQVRGPTLGVTLAYAWLAFPFTLYCDSLGANDSIVAAALVGTLLAAGSPARRGIMAALAAWSKLSPLVLVPVMIGHAPGAGNRRRALLTCAGAFALATAIVLAPTLVHSSLSTFVTRTLGFQLSRPPAFSIWRRLSAGGFNGASWIRPASQIVHGLAIALTGGLAVALLWARKRQDVVGLAGASAALLIALQLCDGYYSFTYILWFAPLVLVALMLSRDERTATAGGIAIGPSREGRHETTVSALGRRVKTS
jgi:hypothetical protein